MKLELDYKLLEPYSREANEITLILEKNVRQLINLLKGNDLTTYLDKSLTFFRYLLTKKQYGLPKSKWKIFLKCLMQRSANT